MVRTMTIATVSQVRTFHRRELAWLPMTWRSAAILTMKTSSTGSSRPLTTCATIMIPKRSAPGSSTTTAEKPRMTVMMPR